MKRESVSNKLYRMRDDAKTEEDKLALAQHLKQTANGTFSQGQPAMALQTYLTGVWVLKEGKPRVTPALTLEAGTAPHGNDVVATLGSGANAAATATHSASRVSHASNAPSNR